MDPIILTWIVVTATWLAVAFWMLMNTLADARALRMRGINDDRWLVVRIDVVAAVGHISIKSAFLALGIAVAAQPVVQTPTTNDFSHAVGGIFVLATLILVIVNYHTQRTRREFVRRTMQKAPPP